MDIPLIQIKKDAARHADDRLTMPVKTAAAQHRTHFYHTCSEVDVNDAQHKVHIVYNIATFLTSLKRGSGQP
jgi:hypothetical protein